jgi:hypothetical protein
VDVAKLRASAASRLGQGSVLGHRRSVDDLVAVARRRSEGATRKPVDVEAKLASGRAMLGANRSGK